MSKYQDVKIVCSRCGTSFVWTKGEQKFMQDLKEAGKVPEVVTPKRCVRCRIQRKEISESYK